MSARLMTAKLEGLKNCTVLESKLTVRGALNPAQNGEVAALADAVAQAVKG